MRKIFSLLCLCFISHIDAQVKKAEKFVENNNYVLTSDAGILMQKYYRETKSVIYFHEKDLGEENFNKMLIFNQKEYWEATSDKFWRDDISKEDKQSAKIVYLSKLTSRLENYKRDVLDKLDDILEEKK